MAEITEVVLELAKQVQEHEKQIGELLDAIQSLQKWLTVAFKEQGFDFAKISRMESSRRQEAIQQDVNLILNPEELDPAFQDEIAKKILKLEKDPRALVNEASNKGRKQ
jgi:hypothetical protein